MRLLQLPPISLCLVLFLPLGVFAQNTENNPVSSASDNASPAGQITFDPATSGNNLRWNRVLYGVHDPVILNVLSSDPEAKPLIDGYRSKSSTVSILGVTTFLLPVAGALIALSASGRPDDSGVLIGGPRLQGLVDGIGIASLGVVSWLVWYGMGNTAKDELAQGVALYNNDH